MGRAHKSSSSISSMSLLLLLLAFSSFLTRGAAQAVTSYSSDLSPPNQRYGSPAAAAAAAASAAAAGGDSAAKNAAAMTAAADMEGAQAAALSSSPSLPVHGHSRMFAADPVVTELLAVSDYERFLKEAAASEKAVIMMLYSAWCPHCYSYRKTFSRLASDLQRFFRFAAVNCMESSSLLHQCSQLGVFALPSIKLFVPASIHQKLPPEEKQQKPIAAAVGHLFLELPGAHGGGVLDSFGGGDSNNNTSSSTSNNLKSNNFNMAVHSLALPSEDVMTAVMYAAKQTLQTITEDDLRLTLHGDVAAFQHLYGKPCEADRWDGEQKALSSPSPSSLRLSSPAAAAADASAAAAGAASRVHDAVRGLQFVLGSWVVTVSDRLSRADEFSIIDLLEAVRASVPIRGVKKAAALATLHLFNSASSSGSGSSRSGGDRYEQPQLQQQEQLERQRGRDVGGSFESAFQVYEELDEALHAEKGFRAAEWRQWVGGLPFGAEAPSLPSAKVPELRHCTTLTCSVWMLMHLLAEGAAETARQVHVHPKCGPANTFYKRKAQALPIYLLKRQQIKQKHLNLQEILDISAMDTSELISHDPALGCMVVPAFDVAYSFFNFLRRFFGCADCRRHFYLHFTRRHYGLEQLAPPQGAFTVFSPFSLGGATPNQQQEQQRQQELLLLEQAFRSQPSGCTDAWKGLEAERQKLDELRLWLWRLHNAVTMRAAADTTLLHVKGEEDAANYANCDVRWPASSTCSSCRANADAAAASAAAAAAAAEKEKKERGIISVPILVARDADKEIDDMVKSDAADFDAKSILKYLNEYYWPKSFMVK